MIILTCSCQFFILYARLFHLFIYCCHIRYLRNMCCRFGLAMASCCHHRCNWASYVGRPFMEQIGFGPVDFHLLTLMSSWAVCGIRNNISSDNDDGDDAHSICG